MYTRRASTIAKLTLFAIMSIAAYAGGIGTGFAYQGQLSDGGMLADGTYDMQFILHSDPSADSPVGSTLTYDGSSLPSVMVMDGLFTIDPPLDFGAGAFDGAPRWIELRVRQSGVGSYTPLSPRTAITPVPYALYAAGGPGGGASIWNQNGTDVYYNQGNVGIGTDTPSRELEIAGTAQAENFTVLNPNNSSASVKLDWHNDVARIRYGGNGTGAQNGFTIQGTGDSVKLRLLNDGSLGLSEPSPQAKLHVRTSDLSLNSSALENDEIIVEGQDAVLGLYSTSQGSWASAIALKEVSGGEVVDTWGIARRTSTATSPSALRFTYGTSDNYAANSSKLEIASDGTIDAAGMKFESFGTHGKGISATQVAAPGQFVSTALQFGFGKLHLLADNGLIPAADSGVVITTDGDVGIGTDNPQSQLHVAGMSQFDGDLRVDGLSQFDNDIRVASTGSREVLIENNAIRMFDSSGNRVFNMYSNASGGGSEAFWANGNGDVTIEVDPDESDHGTIRLFKADGSTAITLDASDSSGNGRISTDVLQINGADLSEQFDINGAQAITPGQVVSIDPHNPGKLAIATEAYDKRVAGIVSGAGGVRTGLLMGQPDTIASGEHAVALTGRVWCFADADFGTIEPGDQLTSSATAGYAMKATDRDRSHGAIIGKAMTGLESGRGMVLVLVQPQ